MSPVLAYNGLALDRVLGRRDAPEWIEAVLARPASRVIPYWRDGCLVRDSAGPRPVVLGAQAAAAVLEHAALCVFLGLDGEAGVFAADLSGLDRAEALVESPGEPRRCLLARHAQSVSGTYALLAGFVEIGESLEDAVRREVAEETGVRIGGIRYVASQAWPFPAGLMVGFRARAVTEAITVDPSELEEARWLGHAELADYLSRHPGRGDSIESFLVSTWLADGG